MSVKLRKKKLANGDLSLWLDIYHKGERSSETLYLYLTKNKAQNKETLIEAEKILAKRQYELATFSHGITPEFKKNINFVEYYKKQLEGKKQRHWFANFKILNEYTKGSIPINQVNDLWLEKYQEYLNKHYSANTVYGYFSTMSVTLNKAVKEKLILSNPMSTVKKIQKQEGQRLYLTLKEIHQLVNTPCLIHEIKKMFLFACFTGLRLSDVKNLKWGELKNGQIEYRQQKTKTPEYLPLSDTAKNIIGFNNSSNIFHMPEKKVFESLPYATMYRELQSWANKAGIAKKVSFHSARHTFATLAITSGGDLYTVSKLLGHKDIATTQIYAKIIDEKKKETIDKLPNIEVNL